MSFGEKQAKYVGRGTSSGFFLPLGKSNAFLGKGWGWDVLGDNCSGMASRKTHKCCTVSVR